MKLSKPLQFVAALLVALSIATLLDVTSTSESYSESYPQVVCPPTLSGLSSQISLTSKKSQFQVLQDKSQETKPVKFLRLPVTKDSLLIDSKGVAPVVWQSRKGSWAGGAVCLGPVSSQWFVGGTADISTRGRLIVINSGLSDAIVDIQVYSEKGKQPLTTINLASKKLSELPIDSFAPGDAILAIHVVPRSGRINSFLVDEQGKGLRALGGDLVNPIETANKTLIIPAIPHQTPKKGKGKATTHVLRLLTPGPIDASVTVEVLSSDGRFIPVGFNARVIPAEQVIEFSLSPKIASSAFALRITASEPIVAAVKSKVNLSGIKDFVWSTSAAPLTPLTIAITGLSPTISFAGDKINLLLEISLVNGKIIRKSIVGSDFESWRLPDSARAFTILKVGKSTFAGALVSSDNGFGYFPVVPGSVLTKIEVPNSNILVLNP